MIKKYLFVIFCTLLFTAASSAAVIILTNGDILKGSVIAQDQWGITFKGLYGSAFIPLNEINSIDYSSERLPSVYVILTNNIVVSGLLVAQYPESIIIKSSNYGEIAINTGNIHSVEFHAPDLNSNLTNNNETVTNIQVTNITVIPAPVIITNLTVTNIIVMETNIIMETNFGTIVKPLNALWRSAVLPSWGQFYSGRPTLGYIVAGTFTASLTTAIIMNVLYNKQIDYWRDNSRLDEDWIKARNYAFANNFFLGMTVGTYIFQVVDAYINPMQNYNYTHLSFGVYKENNNSKISVTFMAVF